MSLLNFSNEVAPLVLVAVHSDITRTERRRVLRKAWPQEDPRAKMVFYAAERPCQVGTRI